MSRQNWIVLVGLVAWVLAASYFGAANANRFTGVGDLVTPLSILDTADFVMSVNLAN